MDTSAWFAELSPVVQALLATLFTWAVTAAGASVVFLFRSFKQTVLDTMLGFAAGVMIAASFWSLLAPAIELAEEVNGVAAWVPAAVGFLAGGLSLWLLNKYLPHIHPTLAHGKKEGVKSNLHRSILLVLAITIHNVPEGLAVGVSFGAASLDIPGATLGAAIALAIGIGLQNFPEGTSVSVPLRREGYSRRKSFWYGQLSGIVEPVGGVIGALLVSQVRPILPYALSYAAGAMIFVVVEELIPESQMDRHRNWATLGVLGGFTIMMILDVALG
ncbi:ZIP family metal transporter [Nafulsella turpanensis]|uniref:ZIP family metal transporter n=1 Tax=Nafulsella turpanensis TaxID=1265690 RepID=UPI00034668B7|nr:ZIP family metal transporter [Nafulsella turpanensis]